MQEPVASGFDLFRKMQVWRVWRSSLDLLLKSIISHMETPAVYSPCTDCIQIRFLLVLEIHESRSIAVPIELIEK